MAKTLTPEHKAALAAGRQRAREVQALTPKGDAEQLTTARCHILTEALGVQVGDRIRIRRGRYAGQEFVVAVVKSSEAEVKVEGPGWTDGRWFGFWRSTGADFDVVQRSAGAVSYCSNGLEAYPRGMYSIPQSDAQDRIDSRGVEVSG
jgi:hypothetical protein